MHIHNTSLSTGNWNSRPVPPTPYEDIDAMSAGPTNKSCSGRDTKRNLPERFCTVCPPSQNPAFYIKTSLQKQHNFVLRRSLHVLIAGGKKSLRGVFRDSSCSIPVLNAALNASGDLMRSVTPNQLAVPVQCTQLVEAHVRHTDCRQTLFRLRPPPLIRLAPPVDKTAS